MAGNQAGGGNGMPKGNGKPGPADAASHSSIVYSLDTLTTSTPLVQQTLPNDAPESSGTIDLTKLPKLSSQAPALLDTAPLLTPEEPPAQRAESERPRSRIGIIVGSGITLAAIGIVAVFVYASQSAAPAQALPATEPFSASTLSSSAAAQPEPSVSANDAITGLSDSASIPVASASALPPLPRLQGTPRKKPPSASAEPAPIDPVPVASPLPASTPQPPAAHACGCAPSDLKCNMDCAIKKR